MRGPSGATVTLMVVVGTIVLGIVVTVTAVLVNRSVTRHHGSRAAELARRWGWSYTERAPWLEKRWQGPSFPSTAGIRIHHVVSGHFAGRQAAVCQLYAYRTRLTVTALATPRALPDIELTPAGVLASVSRFTHGPYVPSGIPQVDQQWRIRTTAPHVLGAVLTPEMIHLLETGLRIPLRFVRGDVISWHENAMDPALVEPHLARLARAIDAVPPQVWEQYGYDPHAGVGGVPGLKE